MSQSRALVSVSDQMTWSAWPGRRHRTAADRTVRLTRRERQIVALLMEAAGPAGISGIVTQYPRHSFVYMNR